MNQGIIKVSDEFWNDKKFGKFIKKNFKVISLVDDSVYGLVKLKCESNSFLLPNKEGELIPEYEVVIKMVDRHFLFFHWKVMRISSIIPYKEKKLDYKTWQNDRKTKNMDQGAD